MNHFKATIRGAAAFSIIVAIIALAVVFLAIVVASALAVFAVVLPVAILTQPAHKHVESWALKKASRKLAKVKKPGAKE